MSSASDGAIGGTGSGIGDSSHPLAGPGNRPGSGARPPASTGGVEIYTFDEHGHLGLVRKHEGWSESLAFTVPGAFSGTSLTDLFIYDRATGEGQVLNSDYASGFKRLQEFSGGRRSWSHIIPGDFGADAYTDLLFYDRDTGEAELHLSDGMGDMRLLKRIDDLGSSWDFIVAGEFCSDHRSDLLLYNRAAGVLELHATDGQGGLTRLQRLDQQLGGWDRIVPIKLLPARHSQLLFYSRRQGLARIYRVVAGGKLEHLHTDYAWGPEWDLVVPVWNRGALKPQVLLYNQSTGAMRLLALNEAGVASLVREHGSWRPGFTAIAAGNFVGQETSDLLCYDRFAADPLAAEARHAIDARYRELQGVNGPLDVPTDDVLRAGRGFSRRYRNGEICWLPGGVACDVQGAFRRTWLSMGGHQRSLGLPVSIVKEMPSGNARYQAFEGGILLDRSASASDSSTGLQLVSEIELSLDAVAQTLPISDGSTLCDDTQNAELALYVWVKVNGEHPEGANGVRIPKECHMGAGGPLQFTQRIPLTGDTVIELLVKAYDWDPIGGEDYLGRWTVDLELEELLEKYPQNTQVKGVNLDGGDETPSDVSSIETLKLDWSLRWTGQPT